MKTIVNIMAICAMLVSFVVQACPTQETTVMYINGVDVKIEDADASKERIKDELLKEGITEDCVKFGFVYNTNELLFADWMESYFQSAGEASDWWRSYSRLETGNTVLVTLFNSTTDFLANLVKTTADAGQWVLGDQKAEHLARFQKELDPMPAGLNRRLILVPHSQGNFYANDEYAELTETQRVNTRIVATATPASFVADNGPYVSVNEDFLASTLFAFLDALPTNTPNNTLRCEGNLASVNRWLCHGFKEEYMAAGKPSRDKIVDDIITALPVAQTPTVAKDIWTTSVFCFCPGGGGPGGGLDNEDLVVGGWGDQYHSLIEFTLENLPLRASSARIEFFASRSQGDGTTALYLDRITRFWDWKTGGTGKDRERLWWADKPSAVQWSTGALPAPTMGQWYSIDITGLYNGWKNGTYPNYGVQLRPVSTSNRWVVFHSSDYTADSSLRPRLVVVPE